MFKVVFKYNLLTFLRQKAVLFWSLAFPLILTLLFYFAFSNLSEAYVMKNDIALAYVDDGKVNPLYDLKSILESIPRSEQGDEKLFTVVTAKSLDEARQMVLDKRVRAVVIDGQTPEMMVNTVSIDEVVIKQVLDQVNYAKNTVSSLARHSLMTLGQNIVGQLNEADYMEPVNLNDKKMQTDVIYYFALLAMTCLGASNAGVLVITNLQANKSPNGARVSVAPASKWLRAASAGLATWALQFVLSCLVFAFMRLALGREFGDSLFYIILLLAVGTMMGVLLGMAIACVARGSLNATIGIATGVYLFSSFLTGLMSDQVKRMVDQKLPLVRMINPGSMIVDAFHSLYFYKDTEYRYFISMLIACAVFIAVIALTLGRRYHDSI